ncbi:MAG TPA: hypothetical protein VGM82_08665 [Gemmatimonadaceae bacterium]|jgi:hypothetical protein
MMIRSAVGAMAALGVLASVGRAQDARATDSRLFPFVGCWRADSAVANRNEALSCVVPVQASSDVELVSIVDGQIANRQRINAAGRPTAVNEEGCRGEQQASWSALPRRIYLHAEFTCAPTGIAGGKTTLMSILPSGERLQVESVRSGVGSITRAVRLVDAGLPTSLPREIAARLGKQRLAVMTARAEAASPLKTTDVVEAVHHTDSTVVYAWLSETGQHFQLNGDQVAALVRADVPAPVLQAMLGGAPSYQLGAGDDASRRATDAYLNSPGTPGGGVDQMTVAGQPPVTYENVNVYDTCCTPAYSAYNYYGPTPYYSGVVYPAPYASYYTYPYRRYPSYYAPAPPVRSYRSTPAPAYYTNPVGVRGGQTPSSPPRQVPSRRRP